MFILLIGETNQKEMENKNSKLATAGLIIITASLLNTPGYVKYFLLVVTTISLVLRIIQYQKEFKATRIVKGR